MAVPRSWPGPGLFALVAALAAGTPAAAQTVRGRVIDAATSQPIAQVQVVLLTADSARVAQVLTDGEGRFLFNARNAGTYRLRAEHIAYTVTATSALELGSREDLVIELKLTTAAIALDPLSVVARRQDARHDPTYEGLYARHRLFPPIGTRRVFVPHDSEMMNAQYISDVLSWSVPPGRGRCMTLYWNGNLVANAVLADMLRQMPVADLEGIEYYRSPTDAPFDYRDVPPYLVETAQSCSVLALWQRTGRYVYETTPHILPDPPAWYPRVHGVAYYVAGLHAPAPGVGVEASSHAAYRGPVQLGVVLRMTVHPLSAATTDAMTATISAEQYRLPPGRRALLLSVLGGEARMKVLQREQLRLDAGLRVQVAQRRFSLESPIVHQDRWAVTSYGAGAGLSLAAEKRLGERTTLTAGLAHDRLGFRRYERIERSWNPTAARWSGTGLRIGILYDLTQ